MKNLNITLLIFFCFISFFVFSQKAEIFTIEQKNDFVKTDKIGNLYIVNGSQLIKLNSFGEREFNFSMPNFGNIYQIDVSNPLNILVFYKTFQTVVRLDNMNVGIGSPISLQNHNVGEALIISNGQDNGFWVFDELNYQLSFINFNGQLVYKSNSIKKLINSRIVNPQMGIYNNRVYLFANNSLYIFDNRANLIDSLTIESEHLIINESGIYKIKDKKLKNLNTNIQNFEILITDYKDFDKIDFYFPYLLLSQKDKITLYLLTSEKPKTHD